MLSGGFTLGSLQDRERTHHTWDSRTYWHTGVTLSPGVFYHNRNTAEPRRTFLGQTDVDSVFLCLQCPCFSSSEAAVMIEKIGGNVKRKQSTSNTLTEPMCRCELTPACLNNPNDLTRIRKKGHTWSEVGDRRGAHAETMPTAEDRSCLRSTADRRRHSVTFDLFRGLVILFMRKLKVRLTLYFSDSDLAGMMYSSHSSS